MIVVEKITKYYGAHRALTDVSFTIAKGEVVGFLGLNGAGKSTMLKILSGLLLPSFGRFSVDGEDGLTDPRALRRRVGFLPDRPPLYDDMTVTELLTYAGRLHGVAREAIAGHVDDAVAKANLGERRDTLIAHLSHGYRQRVGIAQAIVHRPALVILDEPISGLDPVQIVEMRKLVRALAEQHTVLLSSHILSEIAQTCDRLLVLDRGRLVAEGTEEALTGRLGGGRVELVARATPDALRDVLTGVAGTSALTIDADGAAHARARFVVENDASRERVVAAVVARGLPVRAFHDVDDGLESVFIGLLRGPKETTPPVDDGARAVGGVA